MPTPLFLLDLKEYICVYVYRHALISETCKNVEVIYMLFGEVILYVFNTRYILLLRKGNMTKQE